LNHLAHYLCIFGWVTRVSAKQGSLLEPKLKVEKAEVSVTKTIGVLGCLVVAMKCGAVWQDPDITTNHEVSRAREIGGDARKKGIAPFHRLKLCSAPFTAGKEE
jgi:hypothetical protein